METALEVMAEHTQESQPTKGIIMARVTARLELRHGPGEVRIPGRTKAYQLLEELDKRVPTFHGSSKRRREIASRPRTAYGRLRPTRPGEYVLLDTTRSDVFALDPLTLRWVQAEITVAMDWYSRCITGLRVTPVSTKAMDVSGSLYQTFRPRPAGKDWPAQAVWPEHGVPRGVLIDSAAIEGPMAVAAGRQVVAAAGPAVVPETIVVPHAFATSATATAHTISADNPRALRRARATPAMIWPTWARTLTPATLAA